MYITKEGIYLNKSFLHFLKKMLREEFVLTNSHSKLNILREEFVLTNSHSAIHYSQAHNKQLKGGVK